MTAGEIFTFFDVLQKPRDIKQLLPEKLSQPQSGRVGTSLSAAEGANNEILQAAQQPRKISVGIDAPRDAAGDFKPFLQRLITIYFELRRNMNPTEMQALQTEIN